MKTCSWSREQLPEDAEILSQNICLKMTLLLNPWLRLGNKKPSIMLEKIESLMSLMNKKPISTSTSRPELWSTSWWGSSTWSAEAFTCQCGSTSCLSWPWLDPTSFLTSWKSQPPNELNEIQVNQNRKNLMFKSYWDDLLCLSASHFFNLCESPL